MFACSCANPSCLVNGCQIANGYRNPLWSQPYQPQLNQQIITKQHIAEIVKEVLKDQNFIESLKANNE